MAAPTELEAWREVHSTLLRACEVAQDSVDSLKMQYRFWLEEINANLTEDGRLTPTSVWTQARRPHLVKRKSQSGGGGITAGKRKRKSKEPVKGQHEKKAVSAELYNSDGDRMSSPDIPKHKSKKIKISLKKPNLKPAPARKGAGTKSSSDTRGDDDYDNEASSVDAASSMSRASHSMQSPEQQSQNPLQMMAAVAFGASPETVASPSARQALYGATNSEGNSLPELDSPHHGFGTTAATTYGSIQDVVDDDDEDDEEDNPF